MTANWKQRLIWTLADLLGVDCHIHVPTDPVDHLVTLPDDQNTVYAWVFKEYATDADMRDLAEAFSHVGIKRGLRAVHLFVRDIREIREIPVGELRRIVLPILEQEDVCRS
ncbi:MAG TPA: hypothetical protein PKK41_05615 [Methanoculleus sp.]|nr:hypothetical protein [Methanoculleus sp.]